MTNIEAILNVFYNCSIGGKFIFIVTVPVFISSCIICGIALFIEFIKYMRIYVIRHMNNICEANEDLADLLYSKYYSEEERKKCDNRKYRRKIYHY